MRKRLGKQIGRKMLAGVLSTAMVAGLVSASNPLPVMAGDTLPYQGAGKKGVNQPYQHGYRGEDLLSWTPESDPYSELLRARVPLQNRNEAFAATQAHPNLSSEPQYFTLTGDYGNAFFDSYPYTNEFSQHLFNFWQYVDYYASWHGMPTEEVPESLYDADGERNGTSNWEKRNFEFGILNLPNPAYTNAAHKNGVLSIGCIMQPRAYQHFDTLLVQDADGNFPCADKLVEICRYYGFDGWFFNMEGRSITSEQQELLGKFFAQMRKAGLYIQWYTANSSFSTTSTAPYLTSATEGNTEDPELRAQSVFLDYGWYGSTAADNAKKVGLDPYTAVFGGMEAGRDRWSNNYDKFLDGNGNMVMSIASLGTDFVQTGFYENTMQREEDDYQWIAFDRERMWWTGPSFDPTVTQTVSQAARQGIDAGSGSMKGVANYIAERSVINGDVFETSFNTGHGLEYRIDGQISSDAEWSNINVQDYLPTWQWWITSESGNELSADFDYGPSADWKYTDGSERAVNYEKIGGFDGPDSLVLFGDVDSENYIRLYKTDLQVKDTSLIDITFKKTSADDAALKLALIFKDAPEEVVKLGVADTDKAGDWTKTTVDLSEFAGRSIASLGFVVDGTASDYQLNIGKIRLSNGNDTKPLAPTNVQIKNAYDTGEMVVTWDMESYDQVQNYNIYANKDGKRVWLGGNYDSIFYIKSTDGLASEGGSTVTGLELTPSETEALAGTDVKFDVKKLISEVEAGVVTIEVCAVGNGGLESDETSASHNFATAPQNVDVTTSDGLVNVTWDGGYGEVTVTTSCEDEPRTWTASGDGSAEVVVASGKEADGARIMVTVQTQGGTTNYQARLDDSYSTPYDGKVDSERRVFTGPSSKDWYKMHYWYINVKEDGEYAYGEEQVYIRGTKNSSTSNDWAFFKTISDDVDKIAVVLEDYNGNMSEEVIIGNRTLMRVSAAESQVAAGGEVQFTARVINGSENEEDNKIVWSVSGSTDAANTVIDENGLLKVSEKETAERVTVRARLESDSKVYADESISIVPLYTLESEYESAYKGETVQFFVKNNISGDKLDTADYTWSVEGAKKSYWGNVYDITEGTKVEDGLLYVAEGEKNEALKVKAVDADGAAFEKTVSLEDLYGFKTDDDWLELRRGEKYQCVIANRKTGEEVDSSKFNWSIRPSWGSFTSKDTKIDETGLLQIGKDETAYYVYVDAVNKETEAKFSMSIYVDTWSSPVESVDEVTVESSEDTISVETEDVEEKTEETQEVVVEVEEYFAEPEVEVTVGEITREEAEYIWTVEGALSEETAIAEDGTLHIGKDEKAEMLTVKAALADDQQIFATATVNVKKPSLKGEFVKKWGTTYYILEDGTKLTGLHEIDGNLYFFKANGGMTVENYATVDGNTYYFSKEGKAVKGFMTKWGSVYYFDESYVQQKNTVVTVDGDSYYLGAKGQMVKSSFIDLEDGTHYFDKDGKMVKNTTITKWFKKYTFDENGVLVK